MTALPRADRFFSWQGAMLIGASILAGGAFATAFYLRSITLARTSIEICQKVHALDAALVVVIEEAQPTRATLDRFTYYRHHPGERAAVLAASRRAIRRELRVLAAADCGDTH